MARELYIYWRVAGADAQAAAAAAAALQQALRIQHPGLQARLLRRLDRDGDSVTLMEIYTAPPAGVSDAVQADIEARAAPALAIWCLGGRHLEAFNDLSGEGAV